MMMVNMLAKFAWVIRFMSTMLICKRMKTCLNLPACDKWIKKKGLDSRLFLNLKWDDYNGRNIISPLITKICQQSQPA